MKEGKEKRKWIRKHKGRKKRKKKATGRKLERRRGESKGKWRKT